jgi:hypothetical protein
VKRGWQLLPIVAFVGVNLALFCAWPSLQGVRLLFVIFPMLAVLVVVGLMEFWQIAKPVLEVRSLARALKKSSNWVIALSAIVLVQGLATAVHYLVTDTNEAFSEEVAEVYSFVDSSVKPNERISFQKPRLMRYVTGAEVFKVAQDYPVNWSDELPLNTYNINDAQIRLENKHINYWIVQKSRGGIKPPFPIAFENLKFVVYKVK